MSQVWTVRYGELCPRVLQWRVGRSVYVRALHAHGQFRCICGNACLVASQFFVRLLNVECWSLLVRFCVSTSSSAGSLRVSIWGLACVEQLILAGNRWIEIRLGKYRNRVYGLWPRGSAFVEIWSSRVLRLIFRYEIWIQILIRSTVISIESPLGFSSCRTSGEFGTWFFRAAVSFTLILLQMAAPPHSWYGCRQLQL